MAAAGAATTPFITAPHPLSVCRPLSPRRQLRQRMLSIAEQPELFLEQSPQSCNIDVGTAISEAAGAVLQHDHQLRAIRFQLVPKQIPEEVFWARYFGECNRIRQEVLLDGPIDSDFLDDGGSDMVCVPRSPEVVLSEERFQQPEATENAGRWLESSSPDLSPSDVKTGLQSAAATRPAAAAVASSKSATLKESGWGEDTRDGFGYAMMAGDEGGLMPGISTCMGTLQSGLSSNSHGGPDSSGFSSTTMESRSMTSAEAPSPCLTSPATSVMSPGVMSPGMASSGNLPPPASRGSTSSLQSNATEAAAASPLDRLVAGRLVTPASDLPPQAMPGSQSAKQQLPPQHDKGVLKPQSKPQPANNASYKNPTSSKAACGASHNSLEPPREGAWHPREAAAAATAYPSPANAQRLRRLADTLAAARLLCLEDMARLTISPAAAHAEATGTWGGAILRAVGAGRGGAAAAAVVASVSTLEVDSAGARRGIRLPGLGCRVGQQPVDTRGAATQLATANDEVMAAVWKLFEPMPPSPLMSPRGAGNDSMVSPRGRETELSVPWGLPTASAGIEITGWSLEAEVGGAPPRGFLAAVVAAISRLSRVGQMAMFWSEVVDELNCHWSSMRTVTGVPAEQPPAVGICILQQRLQLLNMAISSRRARQAQARCSPRSAPEKGAPTIPAGATHAVPGLSLRDGWAPVWAPALQSAPLFHEDLCRDFPALANCMRGPGSVLRQAVSDMSAFRAVNEGSVPQDYAAWCEKEGRPLPHQLDALLGSVPSSEFYPLRHAPVGPGAPKPPAPGSDSHPSSPGATATASPSLTAAPRASSMAAFQLKSPTSWEDLFWSALPTAAPHQVPLFSAEDVGRAVLESIRSMAPSDVFEQLFLVAVVMEHAEAATSPLLHSSQALETALHEVRCFAASTCGRGMSENKVSRICHVFERLQDMFAAVSKEHQQGFAWEGLPLSSSLTSSSLLGSTMDVDDDEWTMI